MKRDGQKTPRVYQPTNGRMISLLALRRSIGPTIERTVWTV
jgi:hypothetical protein